MALLRRLAALAVGWLLLSPSVAMAESVRAQEIKECRSGELVTWNDGRDRPAIGTIVNFVYNPANAPARFSESLVAAMIAKAAGAWSPCGVPSRLLAGSEGLRLAQILRGEQGVVTVQWDEAESRGNFGLANVGRRSLSLSAKAFDLLQERNPGYDARITLQMVLSHEMGHFFGLMAHSRRCVDVLSYYDNGKGEHCLKRDPLDNGGVVEYRSSLPTACDIARCRIANGK